LVHDKCHQGT